jgi:CDP-2,3-bis-(O-geranylgeranyl)-sn-glycerol synthase
MIEQILKEIFLAFWFFAPAGLANVFAFASGKIKALRPYNYPVDFGLRIRGKRILGSHKTIRGFVIGTIVAILGVYLQVLFYNVIPGMPTITPVNYNEVNPVLLGFLLGFGALLGDAVKSFFKRQAGVQPGRSWVPFDQVDYIVGGIVLSYFYYPLMWYQYLLIAVMWVVIHPLGTFVGYLLKLKRKPL